MLGSIVHTNAPLLKLGGKVLRDCRRARLSFFASCIDLVMFLEVPGCVRGIGIRGSTALYLQISAVVEDLDLRAFC